MVIETSKEKNYQWATWEKICGKFSTIHVQIFCSIFSRNGIKCLSWIKWCLHHSLVVGALKHHHKIHDSVSVNKLAYSNIFSSHYKKRQALVLLRLNGFSLWWMG